ncbi:hypothetical protein KGF57_000910 [Candida theae]|uniref:Uncharacterized protein n=1 Tax=Candida theae TaxID=1198502 RepID=A0AAD5BID9_9ASCO|nr:uncharacterized protein KGF57_000910 [Candida theae]KAI5965117.1 hypothetical protein KGF57_000910 [Candida theae]
MSSVDQSHIQPSQYQYSLSPRINTGTFPLRSPPQPNHMSKLTHAISDDNSGGIKNHASTSPASGYSKSGPAEKLDTVSQKFANFSIRSRDNPGAEKMSSVCRFLDQLVNLKDAHSIIQNPKDFSFYKSLEQEYKLNTHCEPKHDSHDDAFSSVAAHLAIPFDLWLRDEICIKDINVKVTMLKEINGMINAELKDMSNQSTLEVTLNYYSKLLTAYNFYEIPARNTTYKQLTSNDHDQNYKFHDSINEELEVNKHRVSSATDFDFGSLEKPYFHNSNNSSSEVNSNSNSNSNSNNHNSNNSRASISSNSSRKRFSSFLNGGNSNKEGANVSTSPPEQRDASHRRSQLSTPTTPPQPQFKNFSTTSTPSTSFSYHQHQHQSDRSPTPKSRLSEDANGTPNSLNSGVNSILSKSRLYNRIKRNRESGSSVNSNLSHQSNSSNRNSVTTNASGSSRRKSSVTNVKHLFGGAGSTSGNASLAGDVSSFDSSRTLMPPDSLYSNEYVVLTKQEKLENSKEKHEYYRQVEELVKQSRWVLSILFNSSGPSSDKDNSKLEKLIDFITSKVFQFILIDAITMILTYCDLKCCNFKPV